MSSGPNIHYSLEKLLGDHRERIVLLERRLAKGGGSGGGGTLPPPLPPPQVVDASTSNQTLTSSAGAWVDVPTVSAISLTPAHDLWVEVGFTAMCQASTGYIAISVNITGGLSLAPPTDQMAGVTAYGSAPYGFATAYQAITGSKVVKIPGGATTTFQLQAMRQIASGTQLVNYPMLKVIPMYWDGAAGGDVGDIGWVPVDASETVKGIAEIATQAETTAGTDDLRFVTPLKLAQRIAAIPPSAIPQATETVVGGAEIATTTEASTGTDHTRIITPLTLKAGLDTKAPLVHVHPQLGGSRRFLLDATPVGDPGTGRLSVENTGGLNRTLRVSKTDADGAAYSLLPLAVNDSVALTDGTPAPTIYARGYATSVATDNGTYWTFTTVRESGVGVLPADGTSMLLTITMANGQGTALPAAATEAVAGIAEIATQAETTAGVDDARIVTPLKLQQRISAIVIPPGASQATETVAGIAEIATQAETDAGVDNARIVPPLKLKVVTDLLYNKVSLRGNDLITNGNAALGTNYNFSTMTLVQGDQPPGTFGAFYSGAGTDGVAHSRTLDELISVDPSKSYKASMWARQVNPGVTSTLYFGLAPYDADGLVINPYNYMERPNTRTTLAADLVAGQTTMQLTSSANWDNSANATNRGIIFWNYVDGKGKLWAPGTYSRNVKVTNSIYSYPAGGIVGNTVTLGSPHTGATIPAGTEVGNGASAGSYMYAPGITNAVVPSSGAWTQFFQTAPFTGLHTNIAAGATTAFPIATTAVKVIMLLNYNGSGGTTKQYVAGLSLTDAYAPSAATEVVQGIVELATAAETLAGTDNTRAVHPLGLKGALDTKAPLSHTHTSGQITDFATAVPAAVPASSETVQGKIEIATQAEVTTGADDVRAVTPLKLAQRIAAIPAPTLPTASETVKGIVELADATETILGTDTTRAVHPAGLSQAVNKKLELYIPFSHYLAKGTLLAGANDADGVTAVAVGTDGQTLIADSTQAGGVRWGAASGGAPDASETVKGIAEIATTAEVTTGTDDLRFVTPLKLQQRIAAIPPGSVADATETVKGVAEIATAAEATTGTDHTRIITPLTLKGGLDTKAPLSHTHTASQVTDFAEVVRDTMGTALVQGAGISIVPDDAGDTITIAATGTSDSGWVTLSLSSSFSSGTVKVRRIGNVVNIQGSAASISLGANATTDRLSAPMATQFRPNNGTSIGSPVAWSNGEYNWGTVALAGGIQVRKTTAGISTLLFNVTYFVD